MFYSRPPIEPLGWDLVELPTPNGSRNFDGLSSDGRPIDFRFSGGWLTVERGDAGASSDSDMEEVLSLPISPFGVMDIDPEQLCDILGLTVKGQKVVRSAPYPRDRGFDWSGQTTYWHSTHSMMLSRDAGVLAASLSKAFPDAVLVQPVWESGPLRVRCRQIAFLMDSDRMVSIAIGCESGRLQRMLAAEDVPAEEFESVLSHRIDLVRVDEGRDLTGSAQIKARGADALGLDYHVIHHSRYQIRSQFLTDDVRAQSIMKTLLDIIDTHFCRGLQIVRLQTGEVIAEDRDDEEDTKSYSRRFREWCARGPKRYLSVGLRAVPGGEGFDFVGVRPVDDGIVRVAPND